MRRVPYILLIAFGLAQFLQPGRSAPPIDAGRDMLFLTSASDDIIQLVKGACYDCHSDRTAYPWYTYITPINFYRQQQVEEGRARLNFSRWHLFRGSPEARKAGRMTAAGEMPPTGYSLLHGPAWLSPDERQRLAAWFRSTFGAAEGNGPERVPVVE